MVCLIMFYLIILFSSDDGRPGLSSTVGESAGTAMPRLPSCCQQHSPCGGPSPGHLSLSHSHSSCLQASSSQQTSGSQHGHSHSHSHSNAHHFLHHVHHPTPQPPGTLPFPESSCAVERPNALPAPCAVVSSSSNSSSSSNTAHYHDQVCLWCIKYQHTAVLQSFLECCYINILLKFGIWNHQHKISFIG